MEAIKHNHIRALHAPTYWATWEQDLTGLVQDFHARGLVHGDLRDDNFIVPSDGPEIIMLIDFDWGGEAGKVRFPTWLLNEELMDGKRMESLEITREHDIRVLTAALEGLRPVENDPPSKAPSKLKRKAPTSPPSSQPTPCKVAHGLTVAGPSYMGSSSSG
jgi:serine/threonine protein kinase